MVTPSKMRLAGIGLAAVLCGAFPASAQTLGTAQGFAVLAGSTVTNTGASVLTGDLGVAPGSAITGFPPGIVNGATHAADAVALQAQTDLTTAYNALAGQACNTNLTGQDLGGLTLTPGVYCFSTSAQLTGTLTLDALGNSAAVFVFQIGSTLTTASNSTVRVINSGLNCNVFWQVGSSATLGTGTTFVGSILALTSITLNTGANVSGRLLARNGAVTLDTNNVAVCAAACPTITLSPSPLPGATVGAAYTQQVTASGGTGTYTFTVSSGTLSGTLTLSPSGLLSGTPSAPGSVTIRATDGSGCFGEITLGILPAGCPTITLSPSPLPAAVAGVPYNQQITASPAGTYTFTVSSGTLSGTLTLSPSGLLSGTPVTPGTVTIRATDAAGCFVDIPLTIVAFVPASIPTLPGWGLVMFSVLLGLVSIYFVRRASGS